MKYLTPLLFIVGILSSTAADQETEPAPGQKPDVLTPAYYTAGPENAFKTEVDRFVFSARTEIFHHPLQSKSGQIPAYKVHDWGSFGAGKPPWRKVQHHAAADGGETEVALFAAHDGRITTFRDEPKYRHYLAITKEVVDEDGRNLGQLVTLYGHIDPDLNEADGLSLDGKQIRKGELVSRHLYAETKGGPHLHFEVRYYRPGDLGHESFYGLGSPNSDHNELSEASAGPWTLGHWNPDMGYGYGDPHNHGILDQE